MVCGDSQNAFQEEDIQQVCQKQFAMKIENYELWPTFTHTFSHFHLYITPVLGKIRLDSRRVMEKTEMLWYNPKKNISKGLAAPTQYLLNLWLEKRR